jgi:lincosamide nucleotidyltransferase A/C/D/E
VRCEAPAWAVRWHTGYQPRTVDRHDVPLLCERFGIRLPDAFR